MDANIKTTILHALQNHRGDNLARATAAFRHCTPAQLQAEYGESGQTRQEILDGYRRHAEEVDAAITVVEAL